MIIPVHNRFGLAHQTIDSVLAQTYHPIEIVVVDDASSQPFQPSLPGEPKGISLHVRRLEQNVGPGASREVGRQIAQGDYLSYLDSDDLWHEEKVEAQIQMLVDNPQAGMCYCTAKNVDFSTDWEEIRKWSEQAFSNFLPLVLYRRPWGTGACMWTR